MNVVDQKILMQKYTCHIIKLLAMREHNKRQTGKSKKIKKSNILNIRNNVNVQKQPPEVFYKKAALKHYAYS